MGLAFFLIALGLSACILISGHRLSRRKNYWFCFVLACIECVFFPFGTVLGVFTIVVLSRESVKALFQTKIEQPFT